MELGGINQAELRHEDGWGYKIKMYSDVTELSYFEIENGKDVEKDKITFTPGIDIKVCEKIIKMRKDNPGEME